MPLEWRKEELEENTKDTDTENVMSSSAFVINRKIYYTSPTSEAFVHWNAVK